jgi:nicotinamidase-related amidase
MSDRLSAEAEREDALHRVMFPDLPQFDLQLEKAALLIIDMQYLDAHADYGLGRKAKENGGFELLSEYFEDLEVIIPRQQQLLALARRTGLEVIHVCISPNTQDARDCPVVTRMRKIRPPKGTRETEILDELKPEGDEMVLTKITSSAFLSTSLDLILHNMGVDTLIVCGVITNGCVESTVRDGRDLGYKVIVVGDACATWTRDMHERSLRFMAGSFANIRTTADVMTEIEAKAAIGVAAVGTTR